MHSWKGLQPLCSEGTGRKDRANQVLRGANRGQSTWISAASPGGLRGRFIVTIPAWLTLCPWGFGWIPREPRSGALAICPRLCHLQAPVLAVSSRRAPSPPRAVGSRFPVDPAVPVDSKGPTRPANPRAPLLLAALFRPPPSARLKGRLMN